MPVVSTLESLSNYPAFTQLSAWHPNDDAIVHLAILSGEVHTLPASYVPISLLPAHLYTTFVMVSDHEPRLEFPKTLIDNVPIIPDTLNFFFIEPGVEQIFTYITRLPSSIKYILATASFWYDPYTPHTTERVFQIKT